MNQPPYNPGSWGPPGSQGPPQSHGPGPQGPQGPYGAPQGPQGPYWGPPQYPQAPKSNTTAIIVAVIVVIAMLGACGLVGLGIFVARQDITAEAPTKLITSDDHLSEVHVPSSWSTATKLNDQAKLQASNPLREEYLLVLTEAKEDFAPDVTVDKYGEICVGLMKEHEKIADISVSEPTHLEIGGRRAVQYEVKGTLKSVNIAYLLTFVDGVSHFHQVMLWTLKSKFSEKRATLASVANTFRER